ncbi:DapH/DapD/GlmU-related protein [Motiliproteus sp. SC1-56]|uniref:DapH/DapD/GlmU-related protein n=1 Tax=Motiliproteus sp. SC1-56 TaxID=2799565 RepID=UPI001A8D8B2E|nr:DapH/DapD/GlmU-related protein [Motiliproteus sp. SC1-56]
MSYRIDSSRLIEFFNKKEGEIEYVRGDILASLAEVEVGAVTDNLSCPLLSFIGHTASDAQFLLESSEAKIVLVDKGLDVSNVKEKCLIISANARLLFCELLTFVDIDDLPENNAYIHDNVSIGLGTYIGNNCTIEEGVIIGRDCKIFHNVTILKGTVIGDRVSISPGVVIGTDGFGYERRDDGSYIKFPHIGNVVIGNDVDIGANTVIDRGSLGSTKIGNGVKIDNLVHISHNVEIGDNTLVIANAMVGGSVKIGKGSWIGPSSNIVDRKTVGKYAFIGMGVSIIQNVVDNGRYTLKNFLNVVRSRK